MHDYLMFGDKNDKLLSPLKADGYRFVVDRHYRNINQKRYENL